MGKDSPLAIDLIDPSPVSYVPASRSPGVVIVEPAAQGKLSVIVVR